MLDRLERLLLALDTNKPLDADLSSWLGQAIIRHIQQGESLDAALNIRGCRSKFLLDRRDYCLVRAAQLLQEDDPGQSIWHRSARLAELLSRFHGGRWRRLEFKPEPDDLNELDQWLLRALKAGQKIIGHKQVYNILLKNVNGSNFTKFVVNFYYHNKLDKSHDPTRTRT